MGRRVRRDGEEYVRKDGEESERDGEEYVRKDGEESEEGWGGVCDEGIGYTYQQMKMLIPPSLKTLHWISREGGAS